MSVRGLHTLQYVVVHRADHPNETARSRLHIQYGRYTGTAVFHRRADLHDAHSYPSEVIRKAGFREHEELCEVL
jgi:hypothetical protein